MIKFNSEQLNKLSKAGKDAAIAGEKLAYIFKKMKYKDKM